MGQTQSAGTTRPQRGERRPLHPPRKKSIELPDLAARGLGSPSARHSRVSSLTPLSPAPRNRTPIPIAAPSPIPIPNSTNAAGMLDIEQAVSSPSPLYQQQTRDPSPHPPHSVKPPGPPTIAIPAPQPSQAQPRPVPSPSGRASPPARMRSTQQPPRAPDAFIYSSIPLGIALPVTGTQNSSTSDENDGLVSTTIYWRGGGANVFLAGTFESSWRGRIRMNPDTNQPGVFSALIKLPPGNHRLKFVVDDQWRCADDLPTATDNDGHLVNYIEVASTSSASSVTSGWDPSDPSSPTLSRQQNAFGSEIPPHLIHSAHLEERYLSQAIANPPPIPHPAALPRHLEKQILNAHRHGRDRAVMDGVGDDNSVLPVPNHVVLNHLATSAIKNGVLAVATTTRYHKKHITTVYYKPALTT